MSFKKISSKEYEIVLEGRTKTVLIPHGKVEMLFKEFINSGGVIDPVTGQVQNDILSLIASFKSVGNLMLTEFDEEGKVTKEGNCFSLESTDVINLFKLASEVISDFIKGLTEMQTPETPNQPSEKENAKAKKTKD